MSRVRVWTSGDEIKFRRRGAEEVRELLARSSARPTVHLFPRSDGPGSSQDLPQFAAMGTLLPRSVELDDPSWRWSREALRTPGACIDGDPICYRIGPAEDPDAYEYFSPDFHDRPVAVRGEVPGEPRFFVHNVLAQFGLRGVRIDADPMPAVYRGTGLGGSNLAHAGAMILASAVTGTDLSLAEIYIAATQNENYFGVTEVSDEHLEYGVSLTGGQETLTAFQGGFWDNVHVGHQMGPYSVLSRELVSADRYDELERHMLLVNVGARRGAGVTSSGVNHVWMKAWRDCETVASHLRKRQIAYRTSEALREGDWKTYCDGVREYREIRTALCAAYLNGQDELIELCEGNGAELFPLGGGSGTCLVCAVDPASIEAIADAVRAREDEGSSRAVLPFRVRRQGLELHGFEEAGIAEPAPPRTVAGRALDVA